jgi:hypothetical protein
MVIGRVLCLSSLIVRGMLESGVALANSRAEKACFADLSGRLSQWLNEQDFTSQFTCDELDALSAAAGAWDVAQHDAQSDRIEALGVLLWSLSLNEKFPACDESSPSPDLQGLIGWPSDALNNPGSDTLNSFPTHCGSLLSGIARLRETPEILAQRAVVECWVWRARMSELQRTQSVPPNGHDYAMLIGIAAEEAHAAGALPRPVLNDFPIKGRPFSKLPDHTQRECGRLATARQLALDWLCGYATPWDSVLTAVAA